MNARQLWASDVNGDSIRASIADLIYIINVINGTIAPKLAPGTASPTEFIIRNNNGHSSLRMKAPDAVGGFLVELPIADGMVENMQINQALGMDIHTMQQNNRLRICAYNLEGRSIAAGDVELLSFDLIGEPQLADGNVSVSDIAGNMIPGTFKIQAALPTEFSIIASYPNPFNSATVIECAIPQDDNIGLKIYDLAGRMVTDLSLGQVDAGYHRIIWDGTNSNGEHVSTGIYFVRIESNTNGLFSNTKKLTLIK
jgi:hypothetical protein